MALGLFTNYAEIGERAFTKWRALATDIFVQDSWKPTQQSDDRRRRPLGDLAAVVLDDEQHRELRSAVLRSGQSAAIINPATGRLVGGDRYNGIVLPGDGFEGDGNDLVVAQDPRVQALFRGEPRGFSETHYNVFEPRLGASYSINDKTIVRVERRRLPQPRHAQRLVAARRQPAVPADGDRRQRQRGQSRRRAAAASDLPFGMQGQDIVFKHPTAYMWSAGVQREIPFGFVVDATYVGRRGLYLQRERNINQLQPGTLQANPGVATSRRCAPTRATARSASPRTRAARSTTACSSAPTSATATA